MLMCGKSVGLDNLQSEHFKHAGNQICVLLSKLFNSILTYGHLPGKLMETLIVPIIRIRIKVLLQIKTIITVTILD